MNLLITILVTVIIFSILVLVHEMGHFIAAKRAKIKVLEFGIGYPPKLFGKKIGDTLYSINLIPFGGFVRLFGEDSGDMAMAKASGSYSSKRPWQRAKVAFGGVFMNFLLAIILLATGFTFGMEPLIADYDDVIQNINSGSISAEVGVFVKDVKKDSVAEKALLQAKDKILALNSKDLFTYEQLQPILEGSKEPFTLKVLREEKILDIQIPVVNKKDLGIELHPNVFLPKLTVLDIVPLSPFAKAGFQKGDIILTINDKQIFEFADYQAIIGNNYDYNFVVLRNDKKIDLKVNSGGADRVYIDGIFPESSAEKAGFKKGDILVAVNDVLVLTPSEARDAIVANKDTQVKYIVKRDNRSVEIMAQPDETGVLGVALSPILGHEDYKLTLTESPILSSITEMKKLKYPVHKAIYKSFEESVKLGKLTAVMFVDTIRSIVSNLEVSEAVGGPVRIASLTGLMIKEGFMAILRFVALLSLSLGVINLFPLPALDGGRLLFILIEMIYGKALNPRWESLIHLFGFGLLLILIFIITYHDIARLIIG